MRKYYQFHSRSFKKYITRINDKRQKKYTSKIAKMRGIKTRVMKVKISLEKKLVNDLLLLLL